MREILVPNEERDLGFLAFFLSFLPAPFDKGGHRGFSSETEIKHTSYRT